MWFRLVLITVAALSSSDALREARQAQPPNDYSVFVRALPPDSQDGSLSSFRQQQQPIRFNAEFGQPAQPQFAIRPQPQFPTQHQQQTQQNTFVSPQQQEFATFNQQPQSFQFPHFAEQTQQQQLQNQQVQSQQLQSQQLQNQQLHSQQAYGQAQPTQQNQQQTFNNNGPRQFNNNGAQQFSFVDTQTNARQFQFPQQQVTTTTTQNPFALFQQTHSVSVSTSSDPFRHGKVVGSLQPPTQAIQKSPASEIQSDKKAEPKDKAAGSKDKDKDEYVVYYYYYYDDDNKKNNNLSLNFDDVPNLEGFDQTTVSKSNKAAKTPNPQNRFEPKPATAAPSAGQQPAPPVSDEQAVTSAPQTVTQVSFSVSVSEGPKLAVHPFGGRAPLSGTANLDFTGGKLAPAEPSAQPTGGVPLEQRTAHNGSAVSETQQGTNEITKNKVPEVAEITTVTPTTTQQPTTPPPTTTTEELTTTEKTRRTFANRRRPGAGHGHRLPTGRRTHSTTSTTTPAPATRRPVGGLRRNRRPSLRPNRLQFGRRPPPGRQEEEPQPEEEEISEDQPTTTVASTTKKRFGAGRFGNKAARSRSSTTTTTTAAPPRRGGAHLRPSGAGGSLFGRTRNPRPRPAFLRNRGKKLVEEEAEKPVEHEEPAPPATTPADKEELTESSPLKRHEELVEEDVEEEHTGAPPAATQETKPSRSRFGNRPRSSLFGGRPRPNVLGR